MLNNRYDLIIFDMDGTLTKPKVGLRFRKTADDWEILPGVREKLQEIKQQGIKLAIATNQGGIAFGYLKRSEMIDEIKRLCKELGIDYWRMCPTHPGGTIEEFRYDTPMRKPRPGMLLELMEESRIPPGRTLMVGDREEDADAAIVAGVDFMQSTIFFTSGLELGEEETKQESALDDLSIKGIQDLLTTKIVVLEENPKRVYISGLPYGKSKYHILDQRFNKDIQIEEIDIDEKWGKRVVVAADEKRQFLKTLLLWYIEEWKQDEKGAKELGDLNDHPF